MNVTARGIGNRGMIGANYGYRFGRTLARLHNLHSRYLFALVD